jgi:O-antigen/teichoic acid export membrane protein
VKRLLAFSIAIQSVGVASSFLIVFVIARLGGPHLQGQFAVLKSWLDLLGTIAQFGLPQAFVYIINKRLADRVILARWSAAYSIAIVVGAAILTATVSSTGTIDFASAIPVSVFAVVAGLSCGLLNYQRLIRSILITINDGIGFALFTAMPNILLGVAVFALLSAATHEMLLAFVASSAISAIAAFAVSVKLTSSGPKTIPYAPLFHQSWSSFAQAVAASLQVVVLYKELALFSATTSTIGLVSVALLPLVAANAVFAMTAPIFFNRWSKTLASSDLARLGRQIMRLSAACCMFTIAGVLCLPYLAEHFLGDRYVPAIPALQIAAFAMPPLFYSRSISPAFLGLGRTYEMAIIAVGRLVLATGFLAMFLSLGTDMLLGAALSWTGAEWGAAIAIQLRIMGEKQRAFG